MRTKDGAKKLMDLGLQFIPMDQIIKDSIESLKAKGFISWMKAATCQQLLMNPSALFKQMAESYSIIR